MEDFTSTIQATPTKRLFLRKIRKGFALKDLEIADYQRKISSLEAQLEAARPRKRKSLHPDPNETFLSGRQIYRQREGLEEVESGVIMCVRLKLSGAEQGWCGTGVSDLPRARPHELILYPQTGRGAKKLENRYHRTGPKEWSLQDAVLKFATVNGETKYQLEFSQGRCPDHECKNASPRHQQRRPPAKRYHLAGQSPASKASVPTPANEKEWEVEEILASRTNYKKLQYRAKWVGWETDETWYHAEGFKGSPHLKQYHQNYPEMPGPPVRLEQWLRAHEDGVDVEHHPEDNKPVAGATRAKEP
ncbi:hypothetical protein GGTG_14317 [Gaeumannomyces tritici R3-111a-1]|uniref:Chromo domain-containing protein n=1 Tax=Gaeumannomyces tritici (strain R3-111a-1) TaxID=644352 RepID=J3PL69_GAET3|nr:hypothetical protein GGTG_14317 [Gaeumannomyces tritici R3-111a-1]EJT68104.1 hypothetical protein GGTG_14317 [Gaeumannomyces tritici R3-111a-1]